MSFLTSAVLASLVAVGSPPAPPQDVAADVTAGEKAWQEKRWDDASRAFDRAYTNSGDATYLYARAQVERSAGRCETAVGLFEAYLETKPSATAASAAQDSIDECRAEEAAAVPEPTAADPEPAEPGPPPPVAVSDRSGTSRSGRALDDKGKQATVRPWHRDPLGGALVGVGGVFMVTGAALVGAAYGTVDNANEADDDEAFGRSLDRAAVMERAGAASLAVGTVLLAAGIVRWGLVARSRRSAQVVLGPRQLMVSGRF